MPDLDGGVSDRMSEPVELALVGNAGRPLVLHAVVFCADLAAFTAYYFLG